MIFNYHQVTTADDPYLYAVGTDLLAEHLAACQQSRLPFEITFDDGHVTHLRNAVPVLQQFDCPATFFVTMGWTGVEPDYFSWNDIREVRRLGFTVGTHGWSHKFLTQCSAKELERELVQSKKVLEDYLGEPVTTLSFPGGRYNRTVLHACAAAGYQAVYTSDAWSNKTVGALKVYGRMVITRQMSSARLVELLECRGRQPLVSRVAGTSKTAAKKLLGDNLYYRVWSVLARSQRREGMEDAVQG